MIRLNILYRSNFTECYASEPVGDREDLAAGAGLQVTFQGLTREMAPTLSPLNVLHSWKPLKDRNVYFERNR